MEGGSMNLRHRHLGTVSPILIHSIVSQETRVASTVSTVIWAQPCGTNWWKSDNVMKIGKAPCVWSVQWGFCHRRCRNDRISDIDHKSWPKYSMKWCILYSVMLSCYSPLIKWSIQWQWGIFFTLFYFANI